MNLKDRLKHAWNVFSGNENVAPESGYVFSSGGRTNYNMPRTYSYSSFAASIFNRIAIDVATTSFEHVKIDKQTDDRESMNSGLNYCLNTEANIDQSSSSFIQDLVFSMFEHGVIAVVPIETTLSPKRTGGYDILSMRVGEIKEWFPKHVRVNLYNEDTGKFQEIVVPKKDVAIIENPLYAVTNSENSVLKRLLRKMSEFDKMEADIASRKLDLVLQMPYALKTQTQVDKAEERVKHIENQLKNNHHGIAYVDATEKFTQLNRPLDNQMYETVENLTQEFYNQLGLTATIFNGTAKEEEIRTYYTRTIDPIVDRIIEEFNRKFLTKTARSQGQTIEAYRDMFKFVSVSSLADMADKFRRNSVLTSNEIRKILRMKVSDDPRADELYNPNMPDQDQGGMPDNSMPKIEAKQEGQL